MRIACIHVPQFALQSLCRIDPSLRGAAVAVVGAGVEPEAGVRPSLALHSPIVLACSRAAWALGVRLGMTASAARYVSPEVRVVAADGALERETVRAIADALLARSPVVDTGGRVAAGGAHLAMYCEVPSKTRGTTFGDRLIELLDTFGLAARIGIADDRFTAWVAASQGSDGGDRRLRDGVAVARDTTAGREDRGVVSVPRGGSAAFLAPRPLSLLAITPEVQHMLEALGVRTLGAFAGLPAPSVARPLEADYQALARGDSGSTLRPYAPEAPIREELVVGAAGSLFGGAAAVEALAARVALRLAGRARGASRIEVVMAGAAGERIVPVVTERAVSAPKELVELLAPLIGEAPGAGAKLRVIVAGEAIAGGVAQPERAAGVAGVELAAAGVRVGVGGAAAGAGVVGVAAGIAAARAGNERPIAARASVAGIAPIDALAAALANAGHGRNAQGPRAELGDLAALGPSSHGLAWQLSAPQALRSERRDAHRRTRRAKQRRRVVTVAQSQLFGNLGD